MSETLLSVPCYVNRRGGKKRELYEINPLYVSTHSLDKLYRKMSPFKVLFGKQIESQREFISYFIKYSSPSGDPMLNGLFWSVNDLDTGVFYLTDIFDMEATAHFAFFDKRIWGREKLVKRMIRFVFEKYGFRRLNVQIPSYVSEQVHKFALSVGCRLEGVKREASFYDGKWFDKKCYGILASEIMTIREEK